MDQLSRKMLKLNLPGGRVQWAAEPVFDVAELRLIGDGLALSRIDVAEMRDIAKKLQDLAGPGGRAVSHLKKMRLGGRVDASFLRNISEVSRAIQEKHPISCRYTHWNTDGKLVLNYCAVGIGHSAVLFALSSKSPSMIQPARSPIFASSATKRLK